MKVSVYEIVFSLFAKSECRIQIIKHIWKETCVFLFKVSDIEGKMVLAPQSSTTAPF